MQIFRLLFSVNLQQPMIIIKQILVIVVSCFRYAKKNAIVKYLSLAPKNIPGGIRD